MNMNRKQLEPKERELISKVLDFCFELGKTIVSLKDVFSKITLKLDTIPPVYKDHFDIAELKGLRHDVKYFSDSSIVASHQRGEWLVRWHVYRYR